MEFNVNERPVGIAKVVVIYDNGTEREVEKGVVITQKTLEDEMVSLDFEFANISGAELANIIFGVIQMGEQMGLFDNKEEEE